MGLSIQVGLGSIGTRVWLDDKEISHLVNKVSFEVGVNNPSCVTLTFTPKASRLEVEGVLNEVRGEQPIRIHPLPEGVQVDAD